MDKLYNSVKNLGKKYYSQFAKTFIPTELSDNEKFNFLTFNPNKTEIFIQSSEEKYNFQKELPKNFFEFILEKNECEETLLREKENLEKVDVKKVLPIYCNVMDIWLIAEGLKNGSNKTELYEIARVVATELFEFELFCIDPKKEQINYAKKRLEKNM